MQKRSASKTNGSPRMEGYKADYTRRSVPGELRLITTA